MTREIKFRAKTKEGTWFHWKLTDLINMAEMKDAIDWDTLGQYTCLKDKNGKEIYEGDILFFANQVNEVTKKDGIGVVAYEDGCLKVEGQKLYILGGLYWNNSEVIGNIYESPEPLKS